MTCYPTFKDVLLAHSRLIRKFGGASGIRDLGALEAAVARPQTGYYSDIVEQAAALLESLSENQPFVDGNKRTAIAVTGAFLRVNGFQLEFDDLSAFDFLMALYRKSDFRFERLEPWLRKHVQRF